MAKIEKLMPEQIAKFPEYVKKWTDIGLCTDPANRPEAEKAINKSYRSAGLQPPKKIVWCGSPFSQGLVRAIILDKKLIKDFWDSVGASVWDSVWDSVGASVGASVRASVGDSVRDSVGDSVGASVWDSVWDSVGASVWDSVWDSVGASVWASVWDSVGDSVGASVGDSVGASVWDSVWDSVGDSGFGQHDANWLGFYDFFREEAGLQNQTKKIIGLTELSKHAGWFLPHENICWVSERHSILNRDDKGRLHSFNAPAVMYPDGWAIYAVHGVRVPEYVIINPDKITVEDIETEVNAEIRRVKIDRYGQEKFLKDSNSNKIHSDNMGTLWRKDIPNDEPIVMVELINSTPEPDGEFKHYFLRVPPTITNASEAVAWTFGKTAQTYKPMMET